MPDDDLDDIRAFCKERGIYFADYGSVAGQLQSMVHGLARELMRQAKAKTDYVVFAGTQSQPFAIQRTAWDDVGAWRRSDEMG